MLTETIAIHKYIAAKWKPELLLRDSPKDFAVSEMVSAIVHNLKMTVTAACYGRHEGTIEEFCDKVPELAAPISKFCKDKKWTTGDRLCCADFEFCELL